MTKVVLLLLALFTVALIARLDRDGILAHTDFVTRALGVELRIDVMVRRSEGPSTSAASAAPAAPVASAAFADSAAMRVRSCE